MKYQISISGMHCSGCKNLITMSLEDAGFESVSVDSEKNIGIFESSKQVQEIEKVLSEVFKELEEYKYFDLKEINN